MQQIIKAHTAKIIHGKNIIDSNRKTCNCRQPTKCPLDVNCLSSSISYKVTVSLEKEQVGYIGLTFKQHLKKDIITITSHST